MKVYLVSDLSKLFGLGIYTIRKHIREGDLPAQKVGRQYVITEGTLRVFLNDPLVSREPKEQEH